MAVWLPKPASRPRRPRAAHATAAAAPLPKLRRCAPAGQPPSAATSCLRYYAKYKAAMAQGAQRNQRLQLVASHLVTMRRRNGNFITMQKWQEAATSSTCAARTSRSKPEVIFETDGRHSNTYRYEPPMGPEQYVEPIDEVLDLGVDTIS